MIIPSLPSGTSKLGILRVLLVCGLVALSTRQISAQLWQPPQWKLIVGSEEPQTPLPGLVSLYSFDRTIADVHGVNEPVGVFGAAFEPAKVFEGIQFVRVGSLAIPSTGNLPKPGQPFTISAWAKAYAPNATNDNGLSVLVAKQEGQEQYTARIVWNSQDSRFAFGIGPDFAVGTALRSREFPPGEFHYVTATYDSSMIKLFVDGSLEAQKLSASAPFENPTIPWYVGNWNGVIDEVAFYDRALSEAEIAILFSSAIRSHGSRVVIGAVFTPLGDLPGGNFYSEPTAVSAHGTVVVGFSESSQGPEGFRWEAGKAVGVGDLPGGKFWSYAAGVSKDGRVVVGYSSAKLQVPGSYDQEGFIWQDGAIKGSGFIEQFPYLGMHITLVSFRHLFLLSARFQGLVLLRPAYYSDMATCMS